MDDPLVVPSNKMIVLAYVPFGHSLNPVPAVVLTVELKVAATEMVGKEVCDVLGIRNPTMALKSF